MNSWTETFSPTVVGTRRERFTNACMTALRWMGNACGLLATAALLAWIVVKFAR